MANQKFIAIVYIISFLLVFFIFIVYSNIPTFMDNVGIKGEMAMPDTSYEIMNATNSTLAISSMGSWATIILLVGIMYIIIYILFSAFRVCGMAYS